MEIMSVHQLSRGVLVNTRSFPDRWANNLVRMITTSGDVVDEAHWKIMEVIGQQIIEESRRMYPHYRALQECGVVLVQVLQRYCNELWQEDYGSLGSGYYCLNIPSVGNRYIIQEFDFLWAAPRLPEPWEWK